MQMKQGDKFSCAQCGCEVEVTKAPTVPGKGGINSLRCCGETMRKH